MNILDEDGNVIRSDDESEDDLVLVGNDYVPEDKASAEEESAALTEVARLHTVEVTRRQWCVNMALCAYNLETTENNFTRIADKIYDYVYGKKI